MCKDIFYIYFNKLMMVLVEVVTLELFRVSLSEALTSQYWTLTGIVQRPI